MSAGFIYVLANPSLRDQNGEPIFKVGGTARTPLKRAAELSASTSIPACFKVVLEEQCRDWKAVECAVHLSLHRVRLGREFFCAPLEEIAAAIRHALSHLEGGVEPDEPDHAKYTDPVRRYEPEVSPAAPAIIDIQYSAGTIGRIYAGSDMVSFSSRYGTISRDLPPVPRRVRRDRARRIRDYLQRSEAERMFEEIRPVLEPDVALLPNEAKADTFRLALDTEPAFEVAIGERTRWFSRRRIITVTATALPAFYTDRLPHWVITRSGPADERRKVLEETVDAAVSAYVQHVIGTIDSAGACAGAPMRGGQSARS